MTLPFTQELMDGKGVPDFIDFRRAVPGDIDEVVALQERIVDALPDKDLYSTASREEYLEQLNEDICFIAECRGRTAGFSVLVPNDPDNPRNYGKYLDNDRDHLSVTASLDLTMVDPEFIGMGASEGLCTISPDNPYSYRNFLVLNFEIIDQREMYGGKQRYILRKVF